MLLFLHIIILHIIRNLTQFCFMRMYCTNCLVCCKLLILICTFLSCFLCKTAVNPDCKAKACIDFQATALLLQGLGLLALSLSFFFLGVQISRRLYTTQSGFNWSEFLRFNNEIFRISIANIICTLCYILRVFFLLLLVATLVANDPSLPNKTVGVVADNNLWWFLISKWIPFIIPVRMSLNMHFSIFTLLLL